MQNELKKAKATTDEKTGTNMNAIVMIPFVLCSWFVAQLEFAEH